MRARYFSVVGRRARRGARCGAGTGQAGWRWRRPRPWSGGTAWRRVPAWHNARPCRHLSGTGVSAAQHRRLPATVHAYRRGSILYLRRSSRSSIFTATRVPRPDDRIN